MTAVTGPTLRDHPAILAQAAATATILPGRRFTLGPGSGERLDEHVVGGGWPDVSVRLEPFEEALDILRLLFEGGTQSDGGAHLVLEDGRLWDLPERPVPLVAAVRSYLEAGFDHVLLVQIGPEQDGFLRFYEHELRPALEELVR